MNLTFGIIWILLGCLDAYMIGRKFDGLKLVAGILQITLGIMYFLK